MKIFTIPSQNSTKIPSTKTKVTSEGTRYLNLEEGILKCHQRSLKIFKKYFIKDSQIKNYFSAFFSRIFCLWVCFFVTHLTFLGSKNVLQKLFFIAIEKNSSSKVFCLTYFFVYLLLELFEFFLEGDFFCWGKCDGKINF